MIEKQSAVREGKEGQPALFWLSVTVVVLFVILTALFWKGLTAGRTVASNDAPLGAIMADSAQLPSGFKGYWNDLNWLGVAGPSAPTDVSQFVPLVLGKLAFSKVFAAFSVLFLGLSAFICFWAWKWAPSACFLGGLAAALNSNFFCASAWGIASQPIGIGFIFLALAALGGESGPRTWSRLALAGFAVGLAVMEAFDIGAIFSLLVALYAVYQAWSGGGSTIRRFGLGTLRVGVVAACAALIAASTLVTLVGTQIKGVSIQERTGQEKWDYATQWSLPKRETLAIAVPGIFGYRMDTPEGGSYWGIIGRSPAWEHYYAGEGPRPGGGLRFSGGSPYAGVVVVLVALWGVTQSFRKRSPLSREEKRLVWFWLAVGVAALLLSWGRFAPFYQFFYALPFASTIRNPAKFLHVLSFCVVVLFACGTNVLVRQYLNRPVAPLTNWKAQVRKWWAQASAFERKWVFGLGAFLGASLLAWLIYASSKGALVKYLTEVDFDPETAASIASFSIRQPLWFILFFALGGGLLVTICSGYFSGKRSLTAVVLLGLLLTVDLARANAPWVVTYNWKERYASNPVLDFLQKEPYQHRVAILPFQPPPQVSLLHQVHALEWAQHQFLYYNIQSLDVVQLPRSPVDRELFEAAFQPTQDTNSWYLFKRRWALTNTRYLLGPTVYVDYLNQMIDPVERRFTAAMRFDFVPKPGISNPRKLEELTAVGKPDGPYAVIEFTGALPRARLYDQWQVVTNETTTIETLGSPAFQPNELVLVNKPLGVSRSSAVTNSPPGKVEFQSYAPKDVRLKTDAPVETVLLLNDRYDPNWKVEVDGKPDELLRANFLMKAVKLAPGRHSVRFFFRPPVTALYVSLAAVVIAFGLLVLLATPGTGKPQVSEGVEAESKAKV